MNHPTPQNDLQELRDEGWHLTLVVSGMAACLATERNEFPSLQSVVRLPTAKERDDWLGVKTQPHSDDEFALMLVAQGWHAAASMPNSISRSLQACICVASFPSNEGLSSARYWYAAIQTHDTTILVSEARKPNSDSTNWLVQLIRDLIHEALGELRHENESGSVPNTEERSLPNATTKHRKEFHRLEARFARLEQIKAAPLLAELWQAKRQTLWWESSQQFSDRPTKWPKGMLSGSFNPLHEGHIALREAAADHLGGPVSFEMPLVNAEKPPLSYLTIAHRLSQFSSAPVVLTMEPTFVGKAQHLKSTVFVVGWDTAERIIDPRFYGNDRQKLLHSLENIRKSGSRFLVAGRLLGESFCSLEDLALPTGFEDLFDELPESKFRRDVSSSQIRQSPQNR